MAIEKFSPPSTQYIGCSICVSNKTHAVELWSSAIRRPFVDMLRGEHSVYIKVSSSRGIGSNSSFVFQLFHSPSLPYPPTNKWTKRPSHVTRRRRRWWRTTRPRTNKKAQFMALISHEAHQGEEGPSPPRTIYARTILRLLVSVQLFASMFRRGGSECYFIPKFPIEECVAEIRGSLILRQQLSHPLVFFFFFLFLLFLPI